MRFLDFVRKLPGKKENIQLTLSNTITFNKASVIICANDLFCLLFFCFWHKLKSYVFCIHFMWGFLAVNLALSWQGNGFWIVYFTAEKKNKKNIGNPPVLTTPPLNFYSHSYCKSVAHLHGLFWEQTWMVFSFSWKRCHVSFRAMKL